MAATLVPFTADHLTHKYVGWLNDPEVVEFSEQRHVEHNIGTCGAYVQDMRNNGLLWAILMGSVHIGNISAHTDRHNLNADISIMLGEGRGLGFGYSALQQVSDELLQFGYRRLTIGTMARNKPMIAIAQKAGFKVEAVRQNHFLVNKCGVAIVHMARFV